MSQITVKIPDWVVRQAQELAEKEDVPLDQFVALAMAEKVSSLLTVDYLMRRGERGSIEQFRELLARVPDVEPDPSDRLE